MSQSPYSSSINECLRCRVFEFLEQALLIFPDAKRVLLTAYADTDAAIRAINSTQIDYYLLKPWDPPSERLYPVLDDFALGLGSNLPSPI